MSDQRSGEGSPSGNPHWRPAGPRLPVVAPPAYDTPEATAQAHVAWGWSPTAWRQKRVVGR
jgi:hypothetical protein